MELVELAERRSSGVVVRLLWDRVRKQTVLRYRDSQAGERFVKNVPNARALTAFHHPNIFRPEEAA